MTKHAETKQQVVVTVQNEPGNGSYFTNSLTCSYTEELSRNVLKQEQEIA